MKTKSLNVARFNISTISVATKEETAMLLDMVRGIAKGFLKATKMQATSSSIQKCGEALLEAIRDMNINPACGEVEHMVHGKCDAVGFIITHRKPKKRDDSNPN